MTNYINNDYTNTPVGIRLSSNEYGEELYANMDVSNKNMSSFTFNITLKLSNNFNVSETLICLGNSNLDYLFKIKRSLENSLFIEFFSGNYISNNLYINEELIYNISLSVNYLTGKIKIKVNGGFSKSINFTEAFYVKDTTTYKLTINSDYTKTNNNSNIYYSIMLFNSALSEDALYNLYQDVNYINKDLAQYCIEWYGFEKIEDDLRVYSKAKNLNFLKSTLINKRSHIQLYNIALLNIDKSGNKTLLESLTSINNFQKNQIEDPLMENLGWWNTGSNLPTDIGEVSWGSDVNGSFIQLLSGSSVTHEVFISFEPQEKKYREGGYLYLKAEAYSLINLENWFRVQATYSLAPFFDSTIYILNLTDNLDSRVQFPAIKSIVNGRGPNNVLKEYIFYFSYIPQNIKIISLPDISGEGSGDYLKIYETKFFSSSDLINYYSDILPLRNKNIAKFGSRIGYELGGKNLIPLSIYYTVITFTNGSFATLTKGSTVITGELYKIGFDIYLKAIDTQYLSDNLDWLLEVPSHSISVLTNLFPSSNQEIWETYSFNKQFKELISEGDSFTIILDFTLIGVVSAPNNAYFNLLTISSRDFITSGTPGITVSFSVSTSNSFSVTIGYNSTLINFNFNESNTLLDGLNITNLDEYSHIGRFKLMICFDSENLLITVSIICDHGFFTQTKSVIDTWKFNNSINQMYLGWQSISNAAPNILSFSFNEFSIYDKVLTNFNLVDYDKGHYIPNNLSKIRIGNNKEAYDIYGVFTPIKQIVNVRNIININSLETVNSLKNRSILEADSGLPYLDYKNLEFNFETINAPVMSIDTSNADIYFNEDFTIRFIFVCDINKGLQNNFMPLFTSSSQYLTIEYSVLSKSIRITGPLLTAEIFIKDLNYLIDLIVVKKNNKAVVYINGILVLESQCNSLITPVSRELVFYPFADNVNYSFRGFAELFQFWRAALNHKDCIKITAAHIQPPTKIQNKLLGSYKLSNSYITLKNTDIVILNNVTLPKKIGDIIFNKTVLAGVTDLEKLNSFEGIFTEPIILNAPYEVTTKLESGNAIIEWKLINADEDYVCIEYSADSINWFVLVENIDPYSVLYTDINASATFYRLCTYKIQNSIKIKSNYSEITNAVTVITFNYTAFNNSGVYKPFDDGGGTFLNITFHTGIDPVDVEFIADNENNQDKVTATNTTAPFIISDTLGNNPTLTNGAGDYKIGIKIADSATGEPAFDRVRMCQMQWIPATGAFPSSFFAFSQIVESFFAETALNNTGFVTFPNQISRISTLKVLRLGKAFNGAVLNKFPDVIVGGDMSQLTRLDLNQSEITTTVNTNGLAAANFDKLPSGLPNLQILRINSDFELLPDLSSLTDLIDFLGGITNAQTAGVLSNLPSTMQRIYLIIFNSYYGFDVSNYKSLNSLIFNFSSGANIPDNELPVGLASANFNSLGYQFCFRTQIRTDNFIDTFYDYAVANVGFGAFTLVYTLNTIPSGTYQFAATPSSPQERMYWLVKERAITIITDSGTFTP